MLFSKQEKLKPHLFLGQKNKFKPWLIYGTDGTLKWKWYCIYSLSQKKIFENLNRKSQQGK